MTYKQQCECSDPSCGVHLERYQCRKPAQGVLSDQGENCLEFCAECAANALESLVYVDMAWERLTDQ
jgi:hypothetical protein